jgi:predicted DNA repair protein MutK
MIVEFGRRLYPDDGDDDTFLLCGSASQFYWGRYMAGTSLLALIDDIASILDDVSLMTKVAAKKTSGVLGDDLALNAQQVSGVRAERELPVVWAVAKGSFINKLVLVPAALVVSALAPWAVTPLLMLGGLYLCFEGFEKLAHKFTSGKQAAAEQAEHAHHNALLADPAIDMVALEKDKIKGAIRTDFILSAEIIAITLGTVSAAPFVQQLTVLSLIAIVMTIGVYGLVAGIVKLDDGGLYLLETTGAGPLQRAQRSLGRGILATAPHLMKSLSVIGTAAMFMVGGGIIAHGIQALSEMGERVAQNVGALAGAGPLLQALAPTVFNAAIGIVAGALTLAAVKTVAVIVRAYRASRRPLP